MHDCLDLNVFLVKEHVGIFKAANNYDIYDPHSGQMVMHCREPHLGRITRMLRFTDYKRMTPFDVRVTTPQGAPLVRAERGVTFLRSHVSVYDGGEQLLGRFRQRLLSVGGAFDVVDEHDKVLCQLTGKWTGWNFSFTSGSKELAHVTKKWAGVGKELFTSADNYVLEIAEVVPPRSPLRPLILAAVLCIDMVLKE